jgi:hypothetical protein
MENGRKLEVPGETAANYTPAQWAEKKMRWDRKRGSRRGRRNLPNYNGNTSLEHQKSFDKDTGNGNEKVESKQDFIGKQKSTNYTIAKFSGQRTLAELRKRHDQLEVQIKQMKESIALQAEKAKMEVVRKAEEAEKDKDQENEMELDIFY